MKSNKQKLLFVSGVSIPEYRHIYDNLIHNLIKKYDLSVIYLYTHIQISDVIDKILGYAKDVVVLLYSLAYNLYDYIKRKFNRILLFNPYLVTPSISYFLNNIGPFITDKSLINCTRNIIHSDVTYVGKNYNILKKTGCLFNKFLNHRVSRKCGILDNTRVILGRKDILFNLDLTLLKPIYIKGLHILTSDEEHILIDAIDRNYEVDTVN